MDLYPPFRCNVTENATSAAVSPVGELDVATISEVDVYLRTLVMSKRQLILDLRHTIFIDSTTVKLVVNVLALAQQHGCTFTVVNADEHVAQTFELCGIGNLISHGHNAQNDNEPLPLDIGSRRRDRDGQRLNAVRAVLSDMKRNHADARRQSPG